MAFVNYLFFLYYVLRTGTFARTAAITPWQRSLLQRLLTHKFGPLPQGLQQRLQAATPSQLETWSFNILDAETLDEVFAG